MDQSKLQRLRQSRESQCIEPNGNRESLYILFSPLILSYRLVFLLVLASPRVQSTVATAYFAACGSSVAIALAGNQLVKRAADWRPVARTAARLLVPYVAGTLRLPHNGENAFPKCNAFFILRFVSYCLHFY